MPTFATAGPAPVPQQAATIASTPPAGSPAWIVKWRNARKGTQNGEDHYVASEIVAPDSNPNDSRSTVPTILQAIVDLPAGGGTIYLLPGDHAIPNGLVLPANSMLIGAGSSGRIVCAAGAGPALTLGIGAQVINCFFFSAVATPSTIGVRMGASSRVENCTFQDFSVSGIEIAGDRPFISDCMILGTQLVGQTGIRFVTEPVVDDPRILDTLFRQLDRGILATGGPVARSALIEGCSFVGMTIDDIRLDNPQGGVITGNSFRSPVTTNSVNIIGGVEVTVTANRFADVGPVHFLAVAGGSIGKNIFSAVAGGLLGPAIHIDQCREISIVGNTVTSGAAPNQWLNGIRVGNCHGPTVNGTTGAGIVITSNTIRGCSAEGVRIEFCDGVIIGDTSSCQNGTHGILVTTTIDNQTSSRIVVKGNTCDDNTLSGIVVGLALRTVLHAAVGDNVVTDNGEDGISVNGARIAFNCNVCCGNNASAGAFLDIRFAGDTASMTYVGNVRDSDSAPTVPATGYSANGLIAPGTNVTCASN